MLVSSMAANGQQLGKDRFIANAETSTIVLFVVETMHVLGKLDSLLKWLEIENRQRLVCRAEPSSLVSEARAKSMTEKHASHC
jgi:hypothetical protein